VSESFAAYWNSDGTRCGVKHDDLLELKERDVKKVSMLAEQPLLTCQSMAMLRNNVNMPDSWR
jgi:hypothetical protein